MDGLNRKSEFIGKDKRTCLPACVMNMDSANLRMSFQELPQFFDTLPVKILSVIVEIKDSSAQPLYLIKMFSATPVRLTDEKVKLKPRSVQMSVYTHHEGCGAVDYGVKINNENSVRHINRSLISCHTIHICAMITQIRKC